MILPVGSPVPPGPANCGAINPIPTGVCVVRAGWDTIYMDAICPNPGCHYQAPGAPGASPGPAGCAGGPAVGTCVP
jgi:hypothetical protein